MASHLCGSFHAFSKDSLAECIVKFGTGKWFLPSVGLFVSLQGTTLIESLITFGTGKWPLSRVCFRDSSNY